MGRGVYRLELQAERTQGPGTHRCATQVRKDKQGAAPKPPGPAGHLGPRVGAGGRGGPSGRPAPSWGEEAGRRRRREGGDPTCPVWPQAPRAIPVPPAREGKGREGEAAGRWGFPSLPETNWDSGVQTLSAQRGPPPPPFREGRLLPPRVAPTWGSLTPTQSVFSPRSCRVAPTHLSP